MSPPNNRTEILAGLRNTIDNGQLVIGAGAGIGLSAKFIEQGGGDLIIIYNSGRYRMAGRGSLAGLMPYGNANDVVLEMAGEVLPVVHKTPVLAGVCATDPFRSMEKFLVQLKDLGFAGIQNFPTVGLIDGTFRQNLEETGMSYDAEVEIIRSARELDLLTTPYVFNVEEAKKMASVGADILVAHMGLTTSGSIGAASGKSLDECVSLVQKIRDAAIKIKADVIVLCHGGPIARPEDAEYVISRTKGVHGFYGASSMERLPVEEAITNWWIVLDCKHSRLTRSSRPQFKGPGGRYLLPGILCECKRHHHLHTLLYLAMKDTGTAMSDFMPVLIEMMRDPPDPNEALPLSNRLSTAIGVSIPFLALSLIAVGLRLFVRTNVVRRPGWDDAFVALAAVFNVIAQSAFLGGVKNGLGQHLVLILNILPTTMKWFYVANGAYTTTAVCIKLSLLCQYLRLWRESYRRRITIILLIVVLLWGIAFQFMAWFPCFPIEGFWNKAMDPPAKCYGFGYRTTEETKATMLAFAGSNMSLDVVIFLIPLTEYFQPNLKRKQVLAMTSLFAMGFIVVLMSILRLWSGLRYNNRGVLMYDYTFWFPGVMLFSCLEVDFAIMCASVPIFWPTVKAAWSQITVTKEVIVVSESRYSTSDTGSVQMQCERTASLRSQDSTNSLVAGGSLEAMSSRLQHTRPGKPKSTPRNHAGTVPDLFAHAKHSTINNPILPGFHPDPSCIHVPEWNNTFFCTASTFNWFPGLPVYASRDLQHWKLVSNALSRPEQLPYMSYNNRGQSGIYAPTLRYQDGTFTIVTTLANQALPRENLTRWDNIIFNTKDPYGEWDDPIHYYGPGIDPSPFWDENGVAWVSSTFNSSGVVHAPVNLTTGEVTLPFKWLWKGTGGAAPEAAHVYKRNDWYYVMLAEGGTREKHMVTMARSRSLHGPYEGAPNNPLLTAFNNTESYFQAVGHADLFQDKTGQWWAVGLAVRAGGNYADDPYHSNFPMGRETFITPVTWPDNEFPIFTNVSGTVTGSLVPGPLDPKSVPLAGIGQLVDADDDFNFSPGSLLPSHLLHWRLPQKNNYIISPQDHPNTLALHSSMLNLTGFDGDSSLGRGQTYVARRQAHTRCRFSVEVDWSQLSRDSEEVGISIFQDQSQHFDIGVIMKSSLEPRNLTSGTLYPVPADEYGMIDDATRFVPEAPVKAYIRFGGISTTAWRRPETMRWVEELEELPTQWQGKRLRFEIEAVNATHYSFSAGLAGNDEKLKVFGWTRGDLLVPVYSGVTIGTYATSNGRYGERAFAAYVSSWRGGALVGGFDVECSTCPRAQQTWGSLRQIRQEELTPLPDTADPSAPSAHRYTYTLYKGTATHHTNCPVVGATTDHHHNLDKHPNIPGLGNTEATACPALKSAVKEPKAQELDDGLCPIVGTATTVLPPDHPDMMKAGPLDVCPVTKATVGHHKNKVVTHPSVDGAPKDAVCPVTGKAH
ncbi:hypothetical protein OPT61_g1675 [Boeremia exigua]|uniref:Uncharacterized protein n=1 Tax=Boeremia exigua TaxID=749465 RepID=A0ACC2IP96_9PLEO|nr:hypothetical protein OPT61_g1675 [Boeremia exigua]